MNVLGMLSTGISVLGWSLLHFVWQAAVIALVYALVRTVLPRGNPRYLAAMLALIAMATCPIATGLHEFSVNAASVDLASVTVTAAAPTATIQPAVAIPVWQSLLAAALPWLVLAWALGAGVLGVRVFRQWRGLRRMLAAAEQLPEWQSRAWQFAERLGLRGVVPVLASVRVATPTLVGWLKPAVVLPLVVLTQMPPAQIDLVLAHELAHLKRFDHIANLFQVVLETLFFYHPAVHWISREARNERELCCDALALRVTGGERRDFVAALAGLEAFRAGHLDLAVAASGGVLVERAWFIAGATPQRKAHPLRGNVIVVMAFAVLLGLGWGWWREIAWQQRAKALVAANDASILQQVLRDAVFPLTWSPLPLTLPGSRLQPVPQAAVAAPAEVAIEAAPIRVAPVMPSVLTFSNVVPRIVPVIVRSVAPSSGPVNVPQAVRTVRPVYPAQAMIAGVQGQVVVGFTLDASGTPRDLEVVDSSAHQLDVAAMQALAGWRFAPPVMAGRRYRQAFTFKLDVDAADGATTAEPCMIMTGTHICRHVSGSEAGVQVARPNG